MFIAICDSSFISLPEVNDAALMALSINHPYRMWELAAFTVIGSVVGCLLLYTIGFKGGEAMLHKRFAADKVARVRGWYQKYGMLAVIVPSLLPPPLPFKIFVLTAGAFQVPWPRFIMAVAIGRSVRYFTEGLLAVWYGKKAVEMVADNFPIVGIVLAVLIIVGAIVFVSMRRRKLPVSLVLLPLFITILMSGCIKTKVVAAPLPAVPFNREQALQKLESMSGAINTFRSPIGLEGSTSVVKEQVLRKTSPHLAGTLIMKRSGEIVLRGGKLLASVFEIKSDGTHYQIFIDLGRNELYVGEENGPPWEPLTHLDPIGNRFVNLRPKQLREAMLLDFRPLLDNPNVRIAVAKEPEPRDLRTYFTVSFFESSSSKNAKLLQRVWFDLSTDNVDVVRRQTFTSIGDLETDTRYSGHKQIPGSSIRYPSEIDFHIVDGDTSIKFDVDPAQVAVNEDIPPGILELDPHPGAKVIRFAPRINGTVSEQR